MVYSADRCDIDARQMVKRPRQEKEMEKLVKTGERRW